MVAPAVDTEGIFGGAKLRADRAEVALASHVVGLDVTANIGLIFGGVHTVGAAPTAIDLVFHDLGIYQSLEILGEINS
jgi:hypothetical protein